MHLEKDHALHKVCIRCMLNVYLAATRHLCKRSKSQQLFLSYGGKDKGNPESKKWISHWLKMVPCEVRKNVHKKLPTGLSPQGNT